MWRKWVKQILRWSWRGIEVWSALSAVGITAVLRAVLKGIVAQWAWYNQVFLFGGIFLLVLGSLALLSPWLRNLLQPKEANQQKQPTQQPNNLVRHKLNKLDIVVQAIAEAKQITPKGRDTIVFITDSNGLTSIYGIELLSILLKLQNDERILKLKSFPKWLLPNYDEQMGDPEYDMLKAIGIVTDPQENKFVISLEKKFDKWLNNFKPE